MLGRWRLGAAGGGGVAGGKEQRRVGRPDEEAEK